jgi:hypothetical protein
MKRTCVICGSIHIDVTSQQVEFKVAVICCDVSYSSKLKEDLKP